MRVRHSIILLMARVGAATLTQTCREYYSSTVGAPKATKWCNEGEYWSFSSPSNGGQEVSLFTRCTADPDGTAEWGDGKTTIISHGFPTSSFDWQDVVGELEQNGWRACAIDFVGFGFSEKPRSPFVYSMYDQAAALHAFIKGKSITNFTLASHDMGDSIGLIFLQQYASEHKIKKHVVINGSLKLSYANITAMQKLLLDDVTGPVFENLLPAPVLAQGLASSVFTPSAGVQYGHELATVLEFEDGIGVMHDTIQYLNEREQYEDEWLDTWSKSTVPCSLVWGQQDPVATAELGDYLWNNILENRTSAPADYEKVESGNHYLQGDHPAEVARVIMNGGV